MAQRAILVGIHNAGEKKFEEQTGLETLNALLAKGATVMNVYPMTALGESKNSAAVCLVIVGSIPSE